MQTILLQYCVNCMLLLCHAVTDGTIVRKWEQVSIRLRLDCESLGILHLDQHLFLILHLTTGAGTDHY